MIVNKMETTVRNVIYEQNLDGQGEGSLIRMYLSVSFTELESTLPFITMVNVFVVLKMFHPFLMSKLKRNEKALIKKSIK